MIERALAAGVETHDGDRHGDGRRSGGRHPAGRALSVHLRHHRRASARAAKATDETFARLRDLAQHPKVLAIGEIGLDYHYDFSPRDVQRARVRAAAGDRRRVRKPIVIHTREAWDDTLAQVDEPCPTAASCTASPATPRRRAQALDLGFHLSFGGVLTFPKAEGAARGRAHHSRRPAAGRDRCPYLAPVPHRGKRNEPAFVVETARRLAEVRGSTPEAIAELYHS